MAINRKPPPPPVDAVAYVNGGIDGAAGEAKTEPQKKRETKKGGGKTPISITIDRKLLAKIDEAAARQGQSRAAFIAMGMFYVVDRGIFKE